ncbi:hypothetical protein P7K49_036342 [Saguinus oedipus]|uniref:Uncharacterized protein n=1 Tax=Saguinus oedipus TaxID=9490 RepID=A0ABQ9TLI9_SAGOE|nr:hypothetical protein P7K49_036342 [Saguinus oedipus]
MGNTLSCCFCPKVSRRRGLHRLYEDLSFSSDINEVVASKDAGQDRRNMSNTSGRPIWGPSWLCGVVSGSCDDIYEAVSSISADQGREEQRLGGGIMVLPNARPKQSQQGVHGAEPIEGEVVEAPGPTAVEPAWWGLGAGNGHDLQHISDQEMPKGKTMNDTVCPQACLWLTLIPVLTPPPTPEASTASGSSLLPLASFPRPLHQAGELALPRACPHPSFFLPDASGGFFPPPYPNAQFWPLSQPQAGKKLSFPNRKCMLQILLL